MTEKDAIKLGYLEKYARGNVILDTRDEYHANLAFVFDQFNALKAEISSLITTIESQKEEIEKLKEEVRMSLKNGSCEACHIIMHENESLKAITELAVKGLKWYAGERYGTVQFMPPIPDIMILRDCGKCAKDILSEIERLQNAQN